MINVNIYANFMTKANKSTDFMFNMFKTSDITFITFNYFCIVIIDVVINFKSIYNMFYFHKINIRH